MIIPVDVSTKESNNASTKKKTMSERFSTSNGEPSLNNYVETIYVVESYPNIEAYVSTSSEPRVEHPIDSVVDAPIFYVFLNNILDGNDDWDFFEDQAAENNQN
ncbi:unnamed protein product [Vicia faba]|uniref:Uncharacterized protein n=1 Tax=Vicia faba TaxID=3906 RepID=A0AAV1B4R4_VICFA|nr:unnamed protein product [Vicia faba]